MSFGQGNPAGYMGAWPWEPLERLLTLRLGARTVVSTDSGNRQAVDGATVPAIAALLGCHRRQVERWKASGTLTTLWADRAAVALGLHPALVWDGWYADEPQEVVAS